MLMTLAVIRQSDRATVGHIPYNLAPIISPLVPRGLSTMRLLAQE